MSPRQERGEGTHRRCSMHCDKDLRFLFWKVVININARRFWKIGIFRLFTIFRCRISVEEIEALTNLSIATQLVSRSRGGCGTCSV